MRLEFNEEKHEYKLNGFVIPSVTQILKYNGLYDFGAVKQELLEYKAKFGTSFHNILKRYDEGTLDFTTLNPAMMPRLERYMEFSELHGIKHVAIERTLCFEYPSSLILPYVAFAGRIDRVCEVRGFDGLVILDIKTGSYLKGIDLQTAAYRFMWNAQESVKVKHRMCVQLTDKKFKTLVYVNDYDEDSFLACAKVYWYKLRNKLVKESEQ